MSAFVILLYMKRLPFIAFACFVFSTQLLFAQVLMPSKNANSQTLALNGDWKFKLITSGTLGNDSLFFDPAFHVTQWANIKTPGHWELQGFAEPAYGKVTIEGTGLYRKNVMVPASWKNDPVYICFDGVLYGYKLWVNGHFAGEFSSSYNRRLQYLGIYTTG